LHDRPSPIHEFLRETSPLHCSRHLILATDRDTEKHSILPTVSSCCTGRQPTAMDRPLSGLRRNGQKGRRRMGGGQPCRAAPFEASTIYPSPQPTSPALSGVAQASINGRVGDSGPAFPSFSDQGFQFPLRKARLFAPAASSGFHLSDQLVSHRLTEWYRNSAHAYGLACPSLSRLTSAVQACYGLWVSTASSFMSTSTRLVWQSRAGLVSGGVTQFGTCELHVGLTACVKCWLALHFIPCLFV
jgi:hypothetical protein